MKTTTRLMAIVLVMLMAIGMYPNIFVSGIYDQEPNDDFAHASVLAPNFKTPGHVNASDTADYWKFNVVNGENVSIKFEGSNDKLWGKFTDPVQNDIVSDTGWTAAGVPIYINYTTSQAITGFYYFVVQTSDFGFYNLTLKITEPNDAGLGIDGGDTFPTATPITNGTYHGWVGDGDKLDIYKFVVVAAQIINIDFKVGTTTTDKLWAIVYMPNQDELQDLDWVNPGLNTSWRFLTSMTTAGTYYIKVGSGNNNDYRLKLSLTMQNDAGTGHDAPDVDTVKTMVTSGTTYTGEIGNDDNQDIYGFNVSKGQIITVFFKTGTFGADKLYNKLYTPAKDQLVDSGWSNPDVAITYNYTTATANPGVYYIIVLGGDNTYTFKVTIANQNDANKGIDAPDDFPGITVAPGKNFPGWIRDDDQVDYYNINLTKGQMLTINLTEGSTTPANKQYMKLFDATKTQLTEMDYVAAGTTGSLKWTSSYETAGIYYFKVLGGENDYKFSVDVKNQTDATTGMDVPETFEHAVNIKGGTYTGWLADADKVDMYNISVKSGHVFTVNFTAGPGGTSPMSLTVYDGAKNKVTDISSAPDVKATYSLPAASAPLVNSLYYLKVEDGNQKTYTLQVYLPELPPDNTAPVVAITSAISAVSIENASLTGTATDVDSVVAKVQWSLDNATWTDCTGTGAWACTVKLALGANQVTIKATDPAGNKGYKSITLNYDNVPPVLTLTSGSDGSKVSNSKLNLAGTATDNVAILRVEVQVNGGGYVLATGAGSWTYAATLKDGKNTIDIRATDTAGNTVTKTITVTYSKTSAKKGFIPGFEMVPLIGAVLVALVVLSRRKNK